MDYLKNVVIQYINMPLQAPERASLVPVLAMLLQVSLSLSLNLRGYISILSIAHFMCSGALDRFDVLSSCPATSAL